MNDVSENIFSNNKYTIFIDQEIGSGSFSRVYNGLYNNEKVAIKIIKTRNLSSKVINQLKIEIKIINIIKNNPHKNLLKYYLIENHSNLILIIMEKSDGSELTKFINRGLNEIYVKNIIKQIINCYLFLLDNSIVHRDLKPANILVNKNGTIKLIDFGLSKILNNDLSSTMCGSPLYMAPEILYQHNYDSSSDIWSLGILLYELIYGFTPFRKSKNISNLKFEIIKNNIPFPQYTNKNVRISDNCLSFMKSLLNIHTEKRLNWNNIKNNKWLNNKYNNLKKTIIINDYTNNNSVDEQKIVRNDYFSDNESDNDLINSNLLFESLNNSNSMVNSNNYKSEDETIYKTSIEKSNNINIPKSDNIDIYNKSKLDYVDFVMIEKPLNNKNNSSSTGISQFIYSKSAPITNGLISGIKGLHKSATKIGSYLFS